MIRELVKEDLEEVMSMWLETNLKVHDFIEADYWKRNFEAVKEALLQAEVYVYIEDTKIKGFIGIVEGYIAGIFVAEPYRSQGIGKQLISKAKHLYSHLSLSVYVKNNQAVSFYSREGFEIIKEQEDEHTHEKEYVMKYEGV